MADKTIRVVLIGDNTSLRGVLRASATEVKTFGSQVAATATNTKVQTNFIGKAMLGMSAVIVAAFAASAYAAAQFEADMRNVATISPYVQKNFDGVSESLVRMSTTLPQSASTLAKGLYDVASSGFAGAEGIKVLEVSAKAASAGLTDTATSARVVTGVLNAYGLGADQARAVSDVLFQTVNLGVVTFEELAQSLGQVTGLAAQASIPLSDLGAAYATITLSGIPAAESSTALKRVIQSFIDPSEALRDVLLKIGYASGEQAIKQDGLRVVLEKVKAEVGGNVQAFTTLFPEIRAATGALALTANEGRTWDRVARQMGDATAGAGATQKALAQQSQSLSYQLSLTKNRIMALAIELGTALLPAIKLANGALQTAIGFVRDLPGPLKVVVTILAVVTAGSLALGAALLLLAPRIAATKAALASMGTAGTAVQGMATAAGKLALVVGGLAIAASSWGEIGKTTQSTTQGILGMVAAGAMVGGAFGPWGAAIGAAAGGVVGLTKAVIVGSESLEEYHKKFVQVASDAQGLGAKQAAETFIDKLGFSDKAGAGLAKDTEYIKAYGAAWASLKDQQVVNPVKALRNELEIAARTSPAQAAKIVKGLADIRAEAGNPLSKKEIAALNDIVDQGAAKFAKSSQAKQRENEIDRMVASGAMTEKQAIAALGSAADGATSDVLGLTGAQKQLQKVLQQYTNPNDAFKAAVSNRTKAMKDALQAQADLEKQMMGQVSAETQSQIDSLNDASGAWYDFKNSATQSLSDFIAELAKQNYATLMWQQNLITIAKRGGRAFAEQLMALGPEAAPMIAQIATANDEEFNQVKDQFAAQGKLSGDAFTKALDDALNTPVPGTLNGIKQLPAEVQAAVQQTAINLKGSIANMKDDLDNGVISLGTFKDGVAGGVNSLIGFATQAGLSGEAAVRYAENVLGIPKEARTDIENSADPARALIEYYTAKILGIPLKYRTVINADTPDAWKIDTLLSRMRELAGTPWVVSVGIRAPSSVSVAAGGSNPFILEKDGGLVRFFADGGQHVAQIATPGTVRVWNEPEAGGEAYIPLAKSKRKRSVAIWQQTGRMLGTLAFADGGIAAFATGGITTPISAGTAISQSGFESWINSLWKDELLHSSVGFATLRKYIDQGQDFWTAVASTVNELSPMAEKLAQVAALAGNNAAKALENSGLEGQAFERAADIIIEQAQKVKAAAQEMFDSFANPIKELTNLTSAFGKGVDVTAGNILDYFQQMTQGAAEQQSLAKRLAAMGLNQDTLNQLLAGGPDTLNIMRALLSGGPSTIESVNASVNQLITTANQTGALFTNTLSGGAYAGQYDQIAKPAGYTAPSSWAAQNMFTVGDITITITGTSASLTTTDVKKLLADALTNVTTQVAGG